MVKGDIGAAIHEVWTLARRAGEDWFYEMDHERHEAEINTTLAQIALQRTPLVGDLKDIFHQIKARDDLQFRQEMQRHKACVARRDDLKVYYIYNKSDRRLIVLAKDRSCALMFAKQTGHIHEEKNGRVMVLKDEAEKQLRVDGSALGRALRDGFPGAVDQVGENVIHRQSSKVYTPLTMVSKTNL